MHKYVKFSLKIKYIIFEIYHLFFFYLNTTEIPRNNDISFSSMETANDGAADDTSDASDGAGNYDIVNSK